MIKNKKIIKNILREFVADTEAETNVDTDFNPALDEPSTYSRGSVGMDFREKIFDLPYSNTKLLQFIDDMNDLLILNPMVTTLLSQQLQNKLPDTISMLKELDPSVQKTILSQFMPKLKLDFFYLYSMTLAKYNQTEPVADQTEDIPATEPEDETEPINNTVV